MRSNHKLLTVLLDWYKEYGNSKELVGPWEGEYCLGLCRSTGFMREKRLISSDEEDRLDALIQNYNPDPLNEDSPYFYPLTEYGFRERKELLGKIISDYQPKKTKG